MPYPNLFIPGAAKAGTTSVAALLARQPDVFMSRIKEPHHFSRVQRMPRWKSSLRVVDDKASYLRLFDQAGSARWIGEASTSYFWDAEAPHRMNEASPAARVILLLRDPVQRAHSHYCNDVREGLEPRSFEQAVEEGLESLGGELRWGLDGLYVDASFYAERLERFQKIFGERLLVLVFEEVVVALSAALATMCEFLELPVPSDLQGLEEVPENPFAVPRNSLGAFMFSTRWPRALARYLVPASLRARGREWLLQPSPRPPIPERTVARLSATYAADVARCEALLGRSLPWLGRVRLRTACR